MQLMREATWLAIILGVSLLLSVLERDGVIPWPGYPSSLALLFLGMWHRKRFCLTVRLFPEGVGASAFPVAFGTGLAAIVLLAAYDPFQPWIGTRLPLAQAFHLLLVVPLCEEFYFRGLLLEHLRRGFTTIRATVLCTLLFALLHLPVGGALVAGILSLAGCALVVRSGGLAYAVELHVGWNAFAQIHQLDDSLQRWLWAASACAIVAAITVGCVLRGRSTHGAAP